jgi:hypothetical protein
MIEILTLPALFMQTQDWTQEPPAVAISFRSQNLRPRAAPEKLTTTLFSPSGPAALFFNDLHFKSKLLAI